MSDTSDKRKKHRIAKCTICGTEFEVNNHRRTYCTPECAKTGQLIKMREARKPLEREPRSCFTCGEKFIPTNTFRNYCSEECKYKAGVGSRRLPVLPQTKCSVCGETFVPKNQAVTWCSRKCYLILYKSRERMELKDGVHTEKAMHKSNLVEVNKKAKEQGMTYGTYKAQELISRFARVELPEWAKGE